MNMEQSVPKRRHIKFRAGNNPEDSIQHSEHGESLKSRKIYMVNYGTFDNSKSLTIAPCEA